MHPTTWGTQREKDDLATVALSLALVPVTWLLLGWTWRLHIAGGDAVLQGLVTIRELIDAGGSWSRFVYRAAFLGGWKASDTIGPFPLYAMLARLGFTPTTIANLTLFVVQACLAFLGTRIASDLVSIWNPEARRLGWAERAAGVWLCAFAPFLGWRIGSGHTNLLVGLLPFPAVLALLAAAVAETPSLTLIAVSLVSLFLGLLFTGQQIILYGAVFGGPVLLGLWIGAGSKLRHLKAPALVITAALFLALPDLWGMLEHARSGDASRGLGRESVTYAYARPAPGDWVRSIPWTRRSSRDDRQIENELNVPVGPLVLLMALAPWRRGRLVLVGLAAGIIAMLLFSLEVQPFARLLLALVPPLNDFRVPSRTLLPILSVLPAFAVASLGCDSATKPRLALAGLPVAILLFLLPPVGREIVSWGLVLVLCAWRGARPLAAGAALLALCGASVGAFRERLQPFTDGEAALRRAARVGVTMRNALPELQSPLVRIAMGFAVPEFAANTAFAAGLSSLEGYYAPSRRFGSLLYALKGDPYDSTRTYFRIHPDEPAFAALRQLYNVRWRLRRPTHPGAAPKTLLFGPTAGPAWFSASLFRVDDLDALATELRAAGTDLHRLAAEKLWLVSGDSWAAKAPLPQSLDPGCAQAKVTAVEARLHEQEVLARVESPADCPLTFAMNFVERLRAVASSARGRESIVVFPAYGSLAAVWVPKGTEEVRIEAEPPRSPLATLWIVLGSMALAAACVDTCRRSPMRTASP